MKRLSPSSAFTLVEMLVVMAVIAILTGIILSLNGMVQNTGARRRAEAEIRAISGACEAFRADNGGYPQNATITDKLDPRVSLDPNTQAYQNSSRFLWQQLTGRTGDADPTNPIATNLDPTTPPAAGTGGTNYAADIFKDTMFSGTKGNGNRITKVNWIQDPFGNSYGYSTAGLYIEQDYKAQLISSGSGSRKAQQGYNPSFDLWSTAGASTAASTVADPHNKWVKNW